MNVLQSENEKSCSVFGNIVLCPSSRIRRIVPVITIPGQRMIRLMPQ